MGLTVEERRIIVQFEMRKAQSMMSQIEALKNLGYWDNVANRLYCAIFHAVLALLINDGHSVNTHKGAIIMFGQYYVRTGIFDIADGRLYSQLQTIREKCDYCCVFQISEEDVLSLIEPTHNLIKKIMVYVGH
ncbi:MAG: HEPN domain-containing protein [Paludibacteraceae bacterium]|nr:HEPN domain-containing protein [Paludibacteraceae bacterium]